MNKLSNEKSPYLLQHADNLVDWLPWGEDAFLKSKVQDKPLFISIGYSTCHWCHVMAHETFEDAKVAEILNSNFVSIKVDREERPDVDSIYMSACQAYTGSGGWPLTIFADAKQRPFFAGTYFSKAQFVSLLGQIIDLWRTQRQALISQAKELTKVIQNPVSKGEESDLDNIPARAAEYLLESYDAEFGGFSRAPKFPTSHNLLFLLEFYKSTGRTDVLNAVIGTLTAMRQGGIYDHVGGGFSRYSTDRKWLVPHFEKMLYDNALLLLAYSEAYAVKPDNLFTETADGIVQYLNRDLKDRCGAFYAAEDADSEGHEGKFYVFKFSEIKKVLGADAEAFSTLYNITDRGNFEGTNILNNIKNPVLEHQKQFADSCLKKLADYRSTRVRPHRDEKIMVSNNGLVIAALARAGKLLNNNEYICMAKTAAGFIDKNLKTKDGGLISYYLNGAAKQSGFAEDYAFYIFGILQLYAACGDKKYLKEAIILHQKFNEDFFDYKEGGYYLSGKNAEKLLTRTKELYDGAVPSYNSVTLHNLLDLHRVTGEVSYLEYAAKTLKYFSSDLSHFPHGYCHSACAVMRLKTMLPKMRICLNNQCYPSPATINDFTRIFMI